MQIIDDDGDDLPSGGGRIDIDGNGIRRGRGGPERPQRSRWVTMRDEVDEVENVSSSSSTDQPSNRSSAEKATVIGLSTLDLGSEARESKNVTVIGYLLPSSKGSGGGEPVDVRTLANVLRASPNEKVTDLSTLDEVSATVDLDNEKGTDYTSLSSATTDGSQATDVRGLSEALGL